MTETLLGNDNLIPPQIIGASSLEEMARFNESEDNKASSPSEESELTRLREKFGLHLPSDLKQRCQELGSQNYLIDGLLPDRSLGLLVGDSGLGKSALVYQMAFCVASGVPFLGRAVKQGRVVCLDFENGLGQVDGMLDGLRTHLELDKRLEDNLLLWNLNDAHSNYSSNGHNALNMILEAKPTLTIIDSLTGLYPDIEESNKNATSALQRFRTVMRECGTSILALHHIRKPSSDPKQSPPPLETCPNVREWFLQTRGARALINASDIRLGVDLPRRNRDEIILVMRGFGRVKGEIPLIYLSRHYDENGEPLGYGLVKGSNLLFDKEQVKALATLPDKFKFKDANQALSKADEATDKFLKKCIGLGLVRKISRKEGYEKLVIAE
jgi:AAA domain